MKKIHKLSSNVMTVIVIVLLFLAYKSIDDLSSISKFFTVFYNAVKPFITAFLIAYILNMPSKSVEKLLKKTKVKAFINHARGISILLVYFIAVVLITVAIRIIVPKLYENCLDMYKNASLYLEELVTYVNVWLDKFEYNIISLESVTTAILSYLKGVDVTEFSKYAQGVINFTSGVVNAFIAIIASIYMLFDSERIVRAIKYSLSVLISKEKSETICNYFGKVNDIFSKYLYCKLIEAVIVGVISTIILLILDVKYAIMFGVLIAFLNLIPYFGSIISTVCVVVLTLVTGGVTQAIWTAVFLVILEQVDGNFIGPKILDNVLEIRPLFVIISVSVFGSLFGVLGMLFSVPVLVVIKMMTIEFLKNRELKKAKED